MIIMLAPGAACGAARRDAALHFQSKVLPEAQCVVGGHGPSKKLKKVKILKEN
jgi:hypothetical protein